MPEPIYDFAVIGAGMAGASIAAELAPFAKVLVLEAEDEPGYHSTGRSAAFWEECYGGPVVSPLTRASGPFLREHGFLKERGALYIGRNQDRGAIDDFLALFAGSGVELEEQGREGISSRLPHVRKDWTQSIWQPACADIDVAGLHQHYLKALRQKGVELMCRARVSHLVRDAGLWRIDTDGGETFQAERIVNAAGAWADPIAQMAGVEPLGIEPKRRTVAQLRVAPQAPENMPLVLDVNGGFYFKPDNGRLWLSPHDEIPSLPCDAAPEEMDVALAIDRFESVTDWRIEAVERRWAGLRSFAPDRLPVYGPDPSEDSFLWFAGQGGFGIQTAVAAARLGAQLMLGHAHDAITRDLDPWLYSPHRLKSCKVDCV